MRTPRSPASPPQTLAGDFYPPNRLADVLNAPGGMTVAEALHEAAASLQSSEQRNLDRIDEAIAEISVLADGDPPTLADQGRMYDQSSEIVSLAVTVSSRDLADAAFSLCELLTNQRQKGVWLKERVMLHMNAFAVLRRPPSGADAAARSALLGGLKKLANVG